MYTVHCTARKLAKSESFLKYVKASRAIKTFEKQRSLQITIKQRQREKHGWHAIQPAVIGNEKEKEKGRKKTERKQEKQS